MPTRPLSAPRIQRLIGCSRRAPHQPSPAAKDDTEASTSRARDPCHHRSEGGKSSMLNCINGPGCRRKVDPAPQTGYNLRQVAQMGVAHLRQAVQGRASWTTSRRTYACAATSSSRRSAGVPPSAKRPSSASSTSSRSSLRKIPVDASWLQSVDSARLATSRRCAPRRADGHERREKQDMSRFILDVNDEFGDHRPDRATWAW